MEILKQQNMKKKKKQQQQEDRFLPALLANWLLH